MIGHPQPVVLAWILGIVPADKLLDAVVRAARGERAIRTGQIVASSIFARERLVRVVARYIGEIVGIVIEAV